MTIDSLIEKAGREMDAIMEGLTDAQALKMIGAGVDYDSVADLLAVQRAQYAAWRPVALAAFRDQLLREECREAAIRAANAAIISNDGAPMSPGPRECPPQRASHGARLRSFVARLLPSVMA